MTLVLVEVEDGAVSEMSLEAVTFARRVSLPVDALVVGTPGDGVAAQLGEYGVNRVYEAAGDGFASYAAAAWAAAVVAAA